ncbi:hypothetical protein M9H77_02729 [Catharanthus roseus]|uniref:Uncharacterized protein n=1 Tax=Catharanthus roseus TaxID=4058 RepID=A0ACC0C996_CATRO|nr:hypothetical protein M9H77_02729 [Catharanthus roseus]
MKPRPSLLQSVRYFLVVAFDQRKRLTNLVLLVLFATRCITKQNLASKLWAFLIGGWRRLNNNPIVAAAKSGTEEEREILEVLSRKEDDVMDQPTCLGFSVSAAWVRKFLHQRWTN